GSDVPVERRQEERRNEPPRLEESETPGHGGQREEDQRPGEEPPEKSAGGAVPGSRRQATVDRREARAQGQAGRHQVEQRDADDVGKTHAGITGPRVAILDPDLTGIESSEVVALAGEPDGEWQDQGRGDAGGDQDPRGEEPPAIALDRESGEAQGGEERDVGELREETE